MSNLGTSKPLPRNVLGEELAVCGCQPITGWFRNGFCETESSDSGQHSICCVMTNSFLNYSKAQGNDLSTPRPEFKFPGLTAGDCWCVCALRWAQALDDGMAPPVKLEATEISTLNVISLETLKTHSYQGIS